MRDSCGVNKKTFDEFHKRCRALSKSIGPSKNNSAGADCWNAAVRYNLNPFFCLTVLNANFMLHNHAKKND